MSKIRLWTIGNLDGDDFHKWIIPTKAAIDKLRDMLSKNINGGTLDIVWGPDLKCQVISEDGENKILIPVTREDGTVLYRLENIE